MTAPSLATRARRVLDRVDVPRGARVLVACSGGLDSQVLLDVLAHLAAGGRIELVAHGVDHGLRPAAKDELALAAALAARHHVDFSVTRLGLTEGSNLQARAREGRWRALDAAALRAGAAFVATAHHADDRAETVLIRLLRGAPFAGLAVLPARSKDRIRPLIEARRSELAAHAERRSLQFADDPSNRDRRHLRVRVRHELVPLLRALDPRIVEHLCALADEAVSLAPASDLYGVLQRDAEADRLSTRAVAALRDAAAARNPRARIPLGRGRLARWDTRLGIVISPIAPGAGKSARRG